MRPEDYATNTKEPFARSTSGQWCVQLNKPLSKQGPSCIICEAIKRTIKEGRQIRHHWMLSFSLWRVPPSSWSFAADNSDLTWVRKLNNEERLLTQHSLHFEVQSKQVSFTFVPFTDFITNMSLRYGMDVSNGRSQLLVETLCLEIHCLWHLLILDTTYGTGFPFFNYPSLKFVILQ